MKITYLGHSAILIQGSKSIIIDPFLTNNPLASLKPANSRQQELAQQESLFLLLQQMRNTYTSMPIDPTVSSANGTGYYITKSTNGRVTVCAPSAEQGATISVTR